MAAGPSGGAFDGRCLHARDDRQIDPLGPPIISLHDGERFLVENENIVRMRDVYAAPVGKVNAERPKRNVAHELTKFVRDHA